MPFKMGGGSPELNSESRMSKRHLSLNTNIGKLTLVRLYN